MKLIFHQHIRYFGYLFAFALMVRCASNDEIKPIPSISVTPSNPQMNNESITGQVHGAESHLYSIFIYALTSNGWFSLMNDGSSAIRIAKDKSWVCEINNINKDEILKLAIYLIPNGYTPPSLQGNPLLPIKINLVATTKKIIEINPQM